MMVNRNKGGISITSSVVMKGEYNRTSRINQNSVQLSSLAQSCPTLCDPMNRLSNKQPRTHPGLLSKEKGREKNFYFIVPSGGH